MYAKNLDETVRLRLSVSDMDFLRKLSDERSESVSAVIRSIIGEYRRSVQMVSVLQEALAQTKNAERSGLSNGDTKTDKHNFV